MGARGGQRVRAERIAGPAALLLLAACAAGATPPTLLQQDRGIYARATALQAGQSDEGVAPDEAADFAPFAASGAPSAATDDASAGASADLDSSLDGSLLSAEGSATSTASTGSGDATGEAPADVFFEVEFEAAASEAYHLNGSLGAAASDGDGYASVELRDVDAGTSLESYEALPGQADAFSETGMLQAGVTYRLTAFALSHARAAPGGASGASGDATFDVALALPEPSGTLSLAAGCAALAALHGLRSRRGRRGRRGEERS